MPDISMCNGKGCTARLDCYRFTALPTQGRQSYADFDLQDDNEKDDKGRCPSYLAG